MAIDIHNPLLAYRTWFLGQEAGWADTIVNTFDNFSSMLSISKDIVAGSITKEQFEEDCERQEDADRDKYDEEISNYEDGEDAKLFVDYLDKIIEFGDHVLIEPIALALLIATDSFAYILYEDNRPFDLLAASQDALFKNLLQGNEKDVEKNEKNIDEEVKHRKKTKEIRDSWEKLKENEFNLKIIKNYTIRNMFDL